MLRYCLLQFIQCEIIKLQKCGFRKRELQVLVTDHLGYKDGQGQIHALASAGSPVCDNSRNKLTP